MAARDILRNAVVLYATKAVGYAINLWFVFLVANYLGPARFGSLSFALSFAAIFKILTDLGLRYYVTREVSRIHEEASRYFVNAFVLKAGLAAVAALAVVAAANAVEPDPQVRLIVYLVAASVFIDSFTDLFYALFQAVERMEFQAAGQLTKRATLLVGALFGVSQDFTLLEFGYLYVVSAIVPLVFSSYVAAVHLFDFKFDLAVDTWRPLLISALPFGLSVFFITTRFNVDIFLLSIMRGSESAGWFNASYKLVWATVFVPQILSQVVFPALSRLYDESIAEMNRLYDTVVKFLIGLAVPIGVGTLLLADGLVFLVYETSYGPSVTILQIIIWSAVFMFVTRAFETVLNAMDSQRLVTKITGAGAVLNLVLDVALISQFGYVGASVATVVSDVAIFGLYIYSLRVLGDATNPLELLGRYVPLVALSTAVMAGFVLVAEGFVDNVLALVPAAAVVYGLVYVSAGGITREEVNRLRDAVSTE